MNNAKTNKKYMKKEVLTKSKELADHWLKAVNFNGNHDLSTCLETLKGRTGPDGKPVLALVVASPSDVPFTLLFGSIIHSSVSGGQLWGQLEGQLRNQLGGQLEGQLGDQLGDQLGGQLWGQLGDQLRNQLRDQLRNQLWDQLEGQLEHSYRCIWDYYLMAFYESAAQASGISHYLTDQSLLPAFQSGIGYIINMGGLIVGVCSPEAYRDNNLLLHREHGPAIIWGKEKSYWWHGTKIPSEWIENPTHLTPKIALRQTNAELRRSACEILGWNTILYQLNAKTIDEHSDLEIGRLVEVDLPDSPKEKFLIAQCGTGRTFAIPVARSVTTVLEAQHDIYPHIPIELFEKRQARA